MKAAGCLRMSISLPSSIISFETLNESFHVWYFKSFW